MAAASGVTRSVVRQGETRIEVLAQGGGPLVAMIPSLGRGAEDFEDLARRLAAAGYRALRPQPRGIGGSSGPLKGIALHDFARDIAAVLEKHGGGSAVVIGHAFGNFVARTTAADFPERVKAVILLAATHVWPLAPELRASINKSHDMSLPEDERLRCIKHAFFAPGNDPRVWLGGWHEDVMHAERAATEATPREEWWHAGKAPILDVIPAHDACTPPESRNRYREELGADRVATTLIPNAGHALLPEQPEAVAKSVIAYLRQIGHK
ncbi:MAG TPA: alpha/beta fold hydrolase [Burkholderiales bacterium]|nr:alpha/beta fold hydrolase [Burkholderiales bacterium]